MASIAHGDLCVNRCAEPRSVPAERADVRALLAAANARLMARRAQRAESPATATERAPSAEIPLHLGWGRAGLLPSKPAQIAPQREQITLDVVPSAKPERALPKHIVVQPSLLAAILKAEMVSIGRIYLLCRHIDQAGRGWLAIDDLRQKLTDKHSPLRVCGWRRLRQILQAGKGHFWERDDHGRLWLYGHTRVAALFDVQRFSGDAVELPVEILQSSIGTVRSAFYATFHSGRESTPITRATLREITGVAERTQRNYDAEQAVEIKTNLTLVGGEVNAIAFEKGRAAFPFTDTMGKHGAAGKSYVAVRLPNSYQHTRFRRLSGKQKRLNKQLRQDLVKHGTQGNGGGSRRRIFLMDMCTQFKKSVKASLFITDQSHRNTNFWILVDI